VLCYARLMHQSSSSLDREAMFRTATCSTEPRMPCPALHGSCKQERYPLPQASNMIARLSSVRHISICCVATLPPPCFRRLGQHACSLASESTRCPSADPTRLLHHVHVFRTAPTKHRLSASCVRDVNFPLVHGTPADKPALGHRHAIRQQICVAASKVTSSNPH